MSFSKASDLLRLAEMAAARHMGVALADIVAEFEVDHRTAQRMARALEDCFPQVEVRTDDQRRRYWRMPPETPRALVLRGLRDSELVAIEMSIRRAEREGAVPDVRALRSLRDRLLAAMPGPHARRTEADAEAVLEAQGFASRPGPRVAADAEVLSVLAEALKAPNRVTVHYGAESARERRLEPYGLLLGVRRYLVAREVPEAGEAAGGGLKQFRLDRIRSARIEPESFQRDPDFRLDDHAARAFGSFHSDAEYGEVVWRFSPSAAAVAREFEFHPRQEVTEEPDGALTVRFHASGHLEMAWYLYQWGASVEVLAPEALRRLVEGFRRADFPALP